MLSDGNIVCHNLIVARMHVRMELLLSERSSWPSSLPGANSNAGQARRKEETRLQSPFAVGKAPIGSSNGRWHKALMGKFSLVPLRSFTCPSKKLTQPYFPRNAPTLVNE